MSETSLPVESEPSLQEDEAPAGTSESKTPAKSSGKGVKRKCLSPATPSKHSPIDPDLTSSAKRRRKSASSGGTSFHRTGSPLLKPALTERQQLALIMQMTDPHKQGAGSGGEESITSTPRSEPSWTPRSRVQRRNERGETLLHTAAIKGDLKSATSLIEQGAEVNVTDNAGWTPLHEACNYGHLKVAALLLQYHANVNVRGMDGDTPLHDAAINGHLETVKLLLEYNGDPYLENDQGLTPFDVCKNQEILSLLHQSHAHQQEEGGMAPGGGEEESEEEDVFVSKEKSVRVRDSHLKAGSKGSSRSSADSILEEELATRDSERGRGTSPDRPAPERNTDNTPTSRPRSSFYSDLSSSESEGEHHEPPPGAGGKLGGRKVRYHLAKMGEAKQKLLGKLDESSEPENQSKGSGVVKGSEVTEDVGHGSEEDNDEVMDNGQEDIQQDEPPGALTEPASDTRSEPDSTPDSPSSVHSPALSETAADTSSAGGFTTELGTAMEQSASETQHSSSDFAFRGSTGSADSAASRNTKPEQPLDKSLEEGGSSSPEPDILPPVSPGKEEGDDDAPPPMEASSMQEALSRKNTPLREATPPDEDLEEEEEEEEEAAPTRLLRSAIRRVRHSVSTETEEEEGLVVSLSLKLVKSRHSSFDGDGSEDPRRRSDVSHKSDLDPLRLARRLGPLRSDSTSSVDSRSSLSGVREGVVSSERPHPHSKHSRKPQQVFSGRRLAEEGEGREVRRDSLSISVDWGALPGNMSLNNSSFPSTPTQLSSGGCGQGVSSHASPDEHMDTSEPLVGGVRGDETTPTAIVSLPLLFSAAHAESIDNAESASPNDAHHMEGSMHRANIDSAASKDGSVGSKVKSLDMVKSVSEDDVGVAGGSGQEASSGGPRASHQSMPISSLPPKKRYRPVMKSNVIQQRQRCPPPTVPSPAHISSFIMFSGKYRSGSPLQHYTPKLVYPPIRPNMFKLFSEQENERVKLVTAHLTEQDRIVITMEQEVLRAHQRATNKHPPLSVCAVLMENLLLNATGGAVNEGEVGGARHDVSSQAEDVDCKLLAGLVQDVWDRFQGTRFTHSNRQKHEAETMWLMQRLQWRERLRELGVFLSSDSEIPRTHVPLATPALYCTH